LGSKTFYTSANATNMFDDVGFDPQSLNVTDVNSTFMQMWIIPADEQPTGVISDGKLNFTWEVV